jgi:hypothetical protein
VILDKFLRGSELFEESLHVMISAEQVQSAGAKDLELVGVLLHDP